MGMRNIQDATAAAQMFQVGGAIENVVWHGNGHIHESYKVQYRDSNANRSILLQRLNTQIFRDPVTMMRNIQRVTAHLHLRLGDKPDFERRVLQVISARNGNPCYVDQEERYWRAYEFIEGTHSFENVTSGEQAFHAAKAFGTFEALLSDLPSTRLRETISHFHDTPRRFTEFEQVLEIDPIGRAKEAREAIAFAKSRKTLAPAFANANLPIRITHNDAKLNNVLLDDATGEGICVIDLDTVMPGLVVHDFGDMVRTMTSSAAEDEREVSKVQIDMELYDAVLRGYLSSTRSFLTKPEHESLITGAKVIVFEQGLRFLSDFLAGDPYYKMSRSGHNLDRCRTQFKLLESIEKKESEMVRKLRTIL